MIWSMLLSLNLRTMTPYAFVMDIANAYSYDSEHVGTMKEYKITAWPDLPAEFRRTAYRRMVSELSQRHVTEIHLQKCTGASAAEVTKLLDHLEACELLDSREAPGDMPKRRRISWPFHIFANP